MNRRSFSHLAALGASASLGSAFAMKAQLQNQHLEEKNERNATDFSLKFAPHPGLFVASAGDDLLAQIEFAREQGFTAWEDNSLMGRPAEVQQAVGDKLKELGMSMGVFVTYANFNESHWVEKTTELEQNLRNLCKRAVECATRCGAKWTTIVPGTSNERIRDGYAFVHVVELLQIVAEEFAESNLVAVLEPLNPIDHPNCWLKEISQAFAVCKAVGSANVKILDDMYHQQITEGELIRNFDLARSEIAYLQIGDNPGRKEPGSGEINYKNICKHLKSSGFDGIIGMEHGNSQHGSVAGEQHLIEAYRHIDPIS